MKGVVFTEFLEMVECEFGLEVVDKILEASDLTSNGVYTSVATYDHRELLQIIQHLSHVTDMAVPDLVQTFGRYLFGRFVTLFPDYFAGVASASEFLASVDQRIHIEVRKLYPDAEFPRIVIEELEPEVWQLTYESTRPLADLAEGLIAGCVEHFGESIEIHRKDADENPGHSACFLLTHVQKAVPCAV